MFPSEAVEISKKLNLRIISGLDNKRPYVLLCKTLENKKVVLKIDHIGIMVKFRCWL